MTFGEVVGGVVLFALPVVGLAMTFTTWNGAWMVLCAPILFARVKPA